MARGEQRQRGGDGGADGGDEDGGDCDDSRCEGLDAKLAQATKDADKFSKQRLPFADSEVAGELGALAKKQGVKLTRVQYAYAPVLAGTAGELTEAKMDASLSGDYRPLVLFINCAGAGQDVFRDQRGDADRTAERDGGSAAAADDVSAVAGGDGDYGEDCDGAADSDAADGAALLLLRPGAEGGRR